MTYVSGDEDGDGLLDSPVSIFEDSLDETWVFSCVTQVDTTTTNTVVVTGTPVDPEGSLLCGSEDDLADRVAEPCDVTDDAVATVTVTTGGTTSPDLAETGVRGLGGLLAVVTGLLVVGTSLVLLGGRRRRTPTS